MKDVKDEEKLEVKWTQRREATKRRAFESACEDRQSNKLGASDVSQYKFQLVQEEKASTKQVRLFREQLYFHTYELEIWVAVDWCLCERERNQQRECQRKTWDQRCNKKTKKQ